MTNLGIVMGSMDLDELLSKCDETNARLLAIVDEATTPWGIKVMRIETSDIGPPWEPVAATVRQTKAERQADNLSAKAAIATACRHKPRTIPSQITHYRERD
tara:strand:+ start:3647 stop:3952 length:306 start_codon:yes stop_codon:yes gene_type:complete